jgi:Cellulase (glycosyl hydrolase family 5)
MRKFSPTLCALLALTFCCSLSFGQSSSSAARSNVVVSVTPSTATLASSEAAPFTALVKNTPHVAVTWKASSGTISSTGLYQAPKVTRDTVVRLTATSVIDPTKSDAASVVIKAEQPAQASAQTAGRGTAGTIQESFFGADFNGAGVWPPTDGQHQVATLGSIRLWDDGVKWSQIETANGVYNWAPLDNWISKAQAQHMDVLYTIGRTPQWAGSIPKGSPCGPSGPYSCSPPTDVNSDGTGSDAKFSGFITALVNRYKGEIAFYELWNEPDCTCFWSGTQAQLVRMGKDAAAIIRSTDPNARILSPSAHGPTMATWFDGYIVAGGAPNFDIVNAHLRGSNNPPNSDPEAFLTMYADVTAETSKRNLTSLPVWDDEHGIKQNQLTDPDELAGYTARSLVLRAGVGLQRQYVYSWDSAQPYGMQGNESGTAWDVVAGWLIGHSISPCVESGTVYTCAVDDGQIVWDTAQSCSHGNCTTSNYTYPSIYTKKTDLTGTKTSLSGKTVPIGYKPIFLTAN